MTLLTNDELKAKLGDAYAVMIDRYGDDVRRMVQTDMDRFIELCVAGDGRAAVALATAQSSNNDLLAQAKQLTTDMTADAMENAARVRLQKQGASTLAGMLLSIAAAMVGL